MLAQIARHENMQPIAQTLRLKTLADPGGQLSKLSVKDVLYGAAFSLVRVD